MQITRIRNCTCLKLYLLISSITSGRHARLFFKPFKLRKRLAPCMAATQHSEPGKYVVHKNWHFQGVSVRSDGEVSLHVSHRAHEQVCFQSFDASHYQVFKVVDDCIISSQINTPDSEGGGVIDIVNALTGDVLTSVDLDETFWRCCRNFGSTFGRSSAAPHLAWRSLLCAT